MSFFLCHSLIISSRNRLDHQDALKLARRTAEILRTIIAKTKITKQADLIELLRRVGVEMQKAAPLGEHPFLLVDHSEQLPELCIGNITRRVIYFAREEFSRAVECKDDVPSMVRTRSLENYLLGDSQQLDQNCAFHSCPSSPLLLLADSHVTFSSCEARNYHTDQGNAGRHGIGHHQHR